MGGEDKGHFIMMWWHRTRSRKMLRIHESDRGHRPGNPNGFQIQNVLQQKYKRIHKAMHFKRTNGSTYLKQTGQRWKASQDQNQTWCRRWWTKKHKNKDDERSDRSLPVPDSKWPLWGGTATERACWWRRAPKSPSSSQKPLGISGLKPPRYSKLFCFKPERWRQ